MEWFILQSLFPNTEKDRRELARRVQVSGACQDVREFHICLSVKDYRLGGPAEAQLALGGL